MVLARCSFSPGSLNHHESVQSEIAPKDHLARPRPTSLPSWLFPCPLVHSAVRPQGGDLAFLLHPFNLQSEANKLSSGFSQLLLRPISQVLVLYFRNPYVDVLAPFKLVAGCNVLHSKLLPVTLAPVPASKVHSCAVACCCPNGICHYLRHIEALYSLLLGPVRLEIASIQSKLRLSICEQLGLPLYSLDSNPGRLQVLRNIHHGSSWHVSREPMNFPIQLPLE